MPDTLKKSAPFLIAATYLVTWVSVFYFNESDWFGWLLTFFLLHIVLFVSSLKFGLSVTNILLISTLLRLMLSVVSSYIDPVFMGAGDNLNFHQSAANIADTGRLAFAGGSDSFRQFLGFFYYFFGVSYFSAHSLGIFSFTLSCMAFVAILRRLGVGPEECAVPLAIYALFPSHLIFTTIPLRETHQLLLFVCMFYALLSYLERPKILSMLLAILFGTALAVSHKAFSAISFIVLGVAAVWPILTLPFIGKMQLRHALFAAVTLLGISGVVMLLLSGGVSGVGPLAHLANADVGRYFAAIWSQTTEANSTYQFERDASNWFAITITIAKSTAHYLFYPFPWIVPKSLKELYGYFEAMFRLLLIVAAIYSFNRASSRLRYFLSFVGLNYLIIAMLWSIGTINYGTSIRHNITHQWMLIIVAAPGLKSFCRCLSEWGRRIIVRMIKAFRRISSRGKLATQLANR